MTFTRCCSTPSELTLVKPAGKIRVDCAMRRCRADRRAVHFDALARLHADHVLAEHVGLDLQVFPAADPQQHGAGGYWPSLLTARSSTTPSTGLVMRPRSAFFSGLAQVDLGLGQLLGQHVVREDLALDVLPHGGGHQGRGRCASLRPRDAPARPADTDAALDLGHSA